MSDKHRDLVKRVTAEFVPPEEEALARRSVQITDAQPQPAWISRLRTKQVRDYQALIEAETALADSLVGHQRALHRLTKVGEYTAIDDLTIAQAREGAARQGIIRENADKITMKEQELRLAELDERVAGRAKAKPKSQAERVAEAFASKQRAITSIFRERDKAINEVRRRRTEEELSEDEQTQIENIRDQAERMVEEL